MEASSLIKGTFLFALLFLVCFFAYDQIFSEPQVHQGIVLHKVFVPKHNVAGPNATPYGGYRGYKYIIQSQRFHQWVAIVRADDGDTIHVHCTSDHYDKTSIGDTLLFKEYRGKVFGIKYLAHSEEDTLKIDLGNFNSGRHKGREIYE
jgi:hypothetical protein